MASVLITEDFVDELSFENFWGKNDRIKYGGVVYADFAYLFCFSKSVLRKI